MTNICCYQTPTTLPGERWARLITPDGSQFAWAARPDDRRGASLIFDGLAATGVDWRVNPPIRVDIADDGDRLVARLRVRGTKQIIVTNAHYLVPPTRQIAIDLAQRVGADLVFSYEDGHGTTLHRSGLLDDADRFGWPCHPETEPPFTIAPVDRAPTDERSEPSPFPPVIATVGFGLFRHWNRQLLTSREFTHLDELYCSAYEQTRAVADPDTEQIAALAHTLLNRPTRPAAITALRAMQAALFRNGVLWRLPLSSLDAWRESPDSHTITDHEYRRLTKLHNPETAAIAVLAALQIPTNEMQNARLTGSTLTIPGKAAPVAVPDAAIFPLQVAAELTGGPLVTGSQRQINLTVRYLTQQFGFPLPAPRGQTDQRRPLMHPDDLIVLHYRKDT